MASEQPGFFETVQREMRIRGYRHKTIKSYLSCLRGFVRYFHPRHPRSLTDGDIRRYLEYLLIEKRHSAGTVNQVFNALILLYKELYRTPFVIDELPRTAKAKKLPPILNEEEIVRLFSTVKNKKHLLVLMLTYASGLRVEEVVRIRIEDIDSERGLMHIRDAKGMRDRYTIFPASLREPLLEYWKEEELGTTGWLFPGAVRKRHLSERSMQAVIQRAKERSGIGKHVTMHTLRHSFATHLLDRGVDIRFIQQLLGHQSIKTTEIYTHVTTKEIGKIRSPLDVLVGKNAHMLSQKNANLLGPAGRKESQKHNTSPLRGDKQI